MAAWLAMLALFAQLLMVQISTQHLLRLLGASGLPSDICSAQAPLSLSAADTGTQTEDNGRSALPCPVCGAAAASFALYTPAAAASPAPILALSQAAPAAPSPRDLRQGGVRPPAQAPPQG